MRDGGVALPGTAIEPIVVAPEAPVIAPVEPLEPPPLELHWRTPRRRRTRGASNDVPHPVVLVDPRAGSLLAARNLRARGAALVALSARRLEPALHSRGVEAHRMPPLDHAPERWSARLLELAARLEPRPAIFAGSPAAIDFLRTALPRLEPHYTLANIDPCDAPESSIAPDAALRQALDRGEAALEVQIVRDALGLCTGACVLAWAAGAPPDVLVTSVEGQDVVARSQAWLAARRRVGYARLVWSPDRFGRLALQAVGSILGPSAELAQQDGVDFPALAYAAAVGASVPVQTSRCSLFRRLVIGRVEPGDATIDPPLVHLPSRFDRHDPLPWLAALLRGLVRS